MSRSRLRAALNGAHDGGGFAWQEWTDGRPRRLKRGKHFNGDPKLIERQAKRAAEDLGKVAVTSKDGSGTYEYVWVQFVDAEVEAGHPCPVCGGIELEKVQKQFLRCATCGSSLRSADGEVRAGAYPLPAPESSDGDGAAEDQRPPALPNGDYGEIVGTRVYAASGRQAYELSAAEEITIETTIRFAGPVARATLKLWIAVEQAGAVLRLRCPERLSCDGPETFDVAVSVPPALLASREYSVSAGVHYVVDLLQPGTDRLVDSSAGFRVRDARLPGFDADEDAAAVPAFSWVVSTRDEDRRAPVRAAAAAAASLAVLGEADADDGEEQDEDDDDDDQG